MRRVYWAWAQTYLVVRSFADGDAFLYSDWYGRLANKAYPAPADVARTETDAERHFTVAAYDANAAVSSAQVPPLICRCATCIALCPI